MKEKNAKHEAAVIHFEVDAEGTCKVQVEGTGGTLINLILNAMKKNPQIETLLNLALKTNDMMKGDEDGLMGMLLAAMGGSKGES